MPDNSPSLLECDPKTEVLHCLGDWTLLYIDEVAEQIQQFVATCEKTITFNGENLQNMDSAGALALHHAITAAKNHHLEVKTQSFSEHQQALLSLIEEQQENIQYEAPSKSTETILASIGKEAVCKLRQCDGLIVLIGELSSKFVMAMGQWQRLHLPSIVSNIFTTGIQALPILALLSFLIGIVLTYQLGVQLQDYGANIYIAFLTGTAVFREFGPLITAILVAGRTSSSFTAQLGSMKINEEVDALRTMGLSPVELLVLPKVMGLIIVFPLLIFWADVFAMLGSMIMSKFMLQVSYGDFLDRLKNSVGLKHFLLGQYKAPAFAILIAIVGCFQGLRVQSQAASIGSQTTKSVVQALFLIIIADAMFSILYSWLEI